MKSKNAINITDYKILYTIRYLNNLECFPSIKGVFKILTGVLDNETTSFSSVETFKSLVSMTSKRLTRDVARLFNSRFLRRIYNNENEDYYYGLTEEGQNVLIEYESHHKVSIKKSKSKDKLTIIKMTNL